MIRQKPIAAVCGAILAILLQSIAMADEPVSSFAQTGLEQMKRGHYSAAITSLKEALRNNPADLTSRRYLAAALLRTGQAKASVKQLTLISQADPGKIYDKIALADAYFHCNESQLAMGLYSEVLKLEPGQNQARLGLARCQMTLGNNLLAKQICLEALKESSDKAIRKEFIGLLNLIKQREYSSSTAPEQRS